MDRKYEISLWEDIKGVEQFEENMPIDRKICVIGSDTMTSQIQALEPKLVNNINGTNTFSFKMYRTYKDDITGENIINPFLSLLINERKVKVLWKDKWYDLVIKSIVENSADNSIVYTCQDLFIDELSRNGYNLEFTSDLQNNTGTLEELSEMVLEDSGWSLDTDNIDEVYQQMEDAVYEVTLRYELINPIQLPEENLCQNVTINTGSKILVFKSEIDKIVDDFNNTKSTYPDLYNVQFIWSLNSEYHYKENSLVVKEADCYIKELGIDPVWSDEELTSLKFYDLAQGYSGQRNENFSININEVSNKYRGIRYVSSQRSVYDKKLQRFVNVYNSGAYYKIELSSLVKITINGYGEITDNFYLSKRDIDNLVEQWNFLDSYEDVHGDVYKLKNISLMVIDNSQQKFLNYQFNFQLDDRELKIYTNEYPESYEDGNELDYDKDLITTLILDSETNKWEGRILNQDSTADSIIAEVYGYSNTEFDDPMQITNLIVNPTNYKNVVGWTGDGVGGIQIHPKFNQIRNIQDVKSYLKAVPGNGNTAQEGENNNSWTPLLKNALFTSNQSYFKPTQLDIRRGNVGGIKAGDKYVFMAKVALSSRRGDYLTAITNEGKYISIIYGHELYHGAANGSIVACPFIYNQLNASRNIDSENENIQSIPSIWARKEKGDAALEEIITEEPITEITVDNNINFILYFCENSEKSSISINNYPFKVGDQTYFADFVVTRWFDSGYGGTFKQAIINGSQEEVVESPYACLKFTQVYGWNQQQLENEQEPQSTSGSPSTFDETEIENGLSFNVNVEDLGLLTIEKRRIDEKEIYGLYDGSERKLLLVSDQVDIDGYNPNWVIPVEPGGGGEPGGGEPGGGEPGGESGGESSEEEPTTADILNDNYHVTLFISTSANSGIYTFEYVDDNNNDIIESYPTKLRFNNSEGESTQNYILLRKSTSGQNNSELIIVSSRTFSVALIEPGMSEFIKGPVQKNNFYICNFSPISNQSPSNHNIAKPANVDDVLNFAEGYAPAFLNGIWGFCPTEETLQKWWNVIEPQQEEEAALQGDDNNETQSFLPTATIDSTTLSQSNNSSTVSSDPFGDLIEVKVKNSFISGKGKTIPKGATIYLSAYDLDYYGKNHRNWHQGLNGGYTYLSFTYGVEHVADGCLRFKYQDSYDKTMPLMFYDESYNDLNKDDWLHLGELPPATMAWKEYFCLKFIQPKRIEKRVSIFWEQRLYIDGSEDNTQNVLVGATKEFTPYAVAYLSYKHLKYLEDNNILDRSRTEEDATGTYNKDLANNWGEERDLDPGFDLQLTVDNSNIIYKRRIDNYYFDKMSQTYVCKFNASSKERRVLKSPKYIVFVIPTIYINYNEYVNAAKLHGEWNFQENVPSYSLHPWQWSDENPDYRLFNSSDNSINNINPGSDIGLISFTSNDDEEFPSSVYANFAEGLSLVPEVIQPNSLNQLLATNIIEFMNIYDKQLISSDEPDSSNYLLPQRWSYDPDTGYNTCVVSFTTDVSASAIQELQFQLRNYFNSTVFIEDVKFFKYIVDEDGQIIKPGEYGKQSIQNTIYHFYEPNQEVLPEEMEFLYQGKSPCAEIYTPLMSYKKLATIEAKGSNRFNIIQDIGEKFNRWPRFIIEHGDNGSILFGSKKVTFVEQIGKELGWSFEYGIDLKTVRRTIDSNKIVTKTLVLPNNNEFGIDGFCSIARSELNFARENFILNFDYYIKIGLIDKEDLMDDLYGSPNGYYYNLNKFNTEYDKNTEELRKYNMDLVKFSSQMTVLQARQNATVQEITSIKSNMISLANIANGTTDVPELTWEEAYKYLSSHTGDTKVEALLNSYVVTNRTRINTDEEIEKLAKSIKDLNEIIDIYNGKQKVLFRNINECHQEFFNKYSQYIFEGTWQDQNYIEDDKYYLDALEVSAESAFPKLTYEINVMRVSDLEEFKSKVFNVGDSCSIIDRDFFGYTQDNITPYKLPIVITEITSLLNQPEKDVIKVQNYLNSFDDLFQRITATTQSLQYRQGSFERAASIVNHEKTLDFSAIQQSFDDNENLILNSSGQMVTWDSTGLTITDNSNAALKLKLIAGGLFLTNDGGATWKNAIRGDGISADVLTAGRINTNEIYLYDGNNPLFRWDSRGLTAYAKDYTIQAQSQTGLEENDNGTYYSENTNKFNKFIRFDSFGIYGYEGNEDFYPLYEDMIWDNTGVKFGLTWKGFFLRGGSSESNKRLEIVGENNSIKFFLMNGNTDNGVEISTENDIVVRNRGVEIVKIGRLHLDQDETVFGIQVKNINNEEILTVTSDETMSSQVSELGGWIITETAIQKDNLVIDGRTGSITASGAFSLTNTGELISRNANLLGKSTIEFGGVLIQYNVPGIIKLNNSNIFNTKYGYISAECTDDPSLNQILRIGMRTYNINTQQWQEYTSNAEVNIFNYFRVTASGDVQVKKSGTWKNVQTQS